MSDLEEDNGRLREALRVQWEYNHFEHCGREWPHAEGVFCGWPLPIELGGEPGEYRVYVEYQR